MFACWAADDLEGMFGCVDPDFEFRSATDGNLYKGRDGLREFYERWRDRGERLEIPLQRAVEVSPGRILAVGRVRVLQSGRGFADSPGIWVMQVEHGRLIRAEAFRTEREARQALRRLPGSVPSGA